MNQLIWFSIPGAILILALGIVIPIDNLTEKNVVLIVVGIPIVGFIIHQLWRTIFELFWGYHFKGRLIIIELMNEYRISNKEAFPASSSFVRRMLWQDVFNVLI